MAPVWIGSATGAMAFDCVFDRVCPRGTDCRPDRVVMEVQVTERRLVFRGVSLPIGLMLVQPGGATIVSETEDARYTLGINDRATPPDPRAVLSISDPQNDRVIFEGFFGECEAIQ